ncbi:MAG: hypothetical protein QM750_30980 [Rubrivivax sp.]
MSQSLKTVALLSVSAAATTVLIQACGGDARAQAAPDPIEGVWDVAVTQRDCSSGAAQSTFRSNQVFHHGGTFADTSTHPPSTRGPAWGAWTGGGTAGAYTVNFRFIRYNADGSLAGTAVSTLTVTLAADGKSFSATRASKLLDTAGNQVGALCTADAGSRAF